MSERTDWHVGRSFEGHSIEDDCPCEQAACGLVVDATIVRDCPQHGLHAGRTLRQSHMAGDCTAAPACIHCKRPLRGPDGPHAAGWYRGKQRCDPGDSGLQYGYNGHADDTLEAAERVGCLCTRDRA